MGDEYTITVSGDYSTANWEYNVDPITVTDYGFTESSGDEVRVYKCREGAELPVYGTEYAACFDLAACYKKFDEIAYYSNTNQKAKVVVRDSSLKLYPDQRMLVPTGLIFDLKPNQSLRIHPRSGLALKEGIIVANCEGVVDADYVHETFVMLTNVSNIPFEIHPGMRIAQGEIVTCNQSTFTEIKEAPTKKTDRKGGLGSTGV